MLLCFNWKNSSSKLRSFSASTHELQPQSKRRRSSPWPKICRSCGMLPPHRPKTASGCCDCSSKTLPSRSPHPSSFRFTSAGKGTPPPTSLLSDVKLSFRSNRSEEHTSELQSLRHLVC